MKYIDAEHLREKITEQMGSLPREVGRGAGTITSKGYGMMEAFQIMRSIIDSLQQEQPGLPGIEENGIPGKDFIPVEWVDACEMYGKWKIVKVEQQEVDLEDEIDRVIADYSFTKTIDSGGFKTTVLDYAKIARQNQSMVRE